MKKRKKHKDYTRESSKKEYKEIRKKHGDKAKSSGWMEKNGHAGLVNYARKEFGGWNKFKKECGFNDKPYLTYRTKESSKKEYKEIIKKHGDKAKNSSWMCKNGHRGLVQYACKTFGGWNKFKKECGINIKPHRTKKSTKKEYKEIIKKHGDKAKSSGWMMKNGHGGLVSYACKAFGNWDNFKKECGINDKPLIIFRTKKSTKKEYKEIIKKHGDKAKSSVWMRKNGHSGLVSYASNAFGNWNNFKKECGINDKNLHTLWTKESSKKEYKEAIKKHGDKAKNSEWMNKNGHSGLVSYARKAFGYWSKFQKECGIDINPYRTKKSTKKEYKEIIKKHGDKAKSSGWMQKNGHSGLVSYACKAFGGWNNFKKECGINDKPLRTRWTKESAIIKYTEIIKKHGDKAKSSEWMNKNGFGGLVSYVSNAFGLWKKFLDFYNHSYTLSENELRIAS